MIRGKNLFLIYQLRISLLVLHKEESQWDFLLKNSKRIYKINHKHNLMNKKIQILINKSQINNYHHNNQNYVTFLINHRNNNTNKEYNNLKVFKFNKEDQFIKNRYLGYINIFFIRIILF